MKATFQKQQAVTDTIHTFWFRPERPLHYTAGQYTELTLNHGNPDNRGIKRWFTLSSPPNGELVSITTRFAGNEKSSTFKKTLFGLKPGTVVDIAEPMGDFVLPKLLQTPLVFVAGGIGMTPFHSMLEWLAETGEQRNIHLFYAVRTEDDIIFQDTLDKAGVHATIVVGEPSAAWGGERGTLNADIIMGLQPAAEDTLIYLSGPEPMLEALEKDLLEHRIDKRQIVTDFFPGYPVI